MRHTLIALGLAVATLFAAGLRQGDYGQIEVVADTAGVAITNGVDILVVNYGESTVYFCFEEPVGGTEWKRLGPLGSYWFPAPAERDGIDLIDTLVVRSSDTVTVGYDSWRRP